MKKTEVRLFFMNIFKGTAMLKGTMKLSALVLSLSMMTSGCALAEWAKTVGQPQQAENKGVDNRIYSSNQFWQNYMLIINMS